MLSDKEIIANVDLSQEAKYEHEGESLHTFDVIPLLQAQEQATRQEVAEWLMAHRTMWGNYASADVKITIETMYLPQWAGALCQERYCEACYIPLKEATDVPTLLEDRQD